MGYFQRGCGHRCGGTAVRQTVTGHTLQIGRPSAGVGSVIAAVLLAWRPATAPANSRSNSNYPLPINLETYRKLRNQIAKILVHCCRCGCTLRAPKAFREALPGTLRDPRHRLSQTPVVDPAATRANHSPNSPTPLRRCGGPGATSLRRSRVIGRTAT